MATPMANPFPHNRRRGWIVIAVVLAFIVVGGLVYGSVFNGFGSQPINTPITPITTDQLFAAYFGSGGTPGNQASADAQYLNKVAYVTGTVEGVAKDNNRNQYFSTMGLGTEAVWYWSDSSQASQLTVGQTIEAECTISGLEQSANGGYNLYLDNCVLASQG